MTWKLTVRSNPGSTVRADYECPVHGRFTLDVVRDEKGDPPDWAVCPEPLSFAEQQDTAEYAPDFRWKSTRERCDEVSPWRPAKSGSVGVKAGEVVRGKSDARPGDKHVMDTSKLADGMPYDQWKAERASVHRDESLRRVRKAFGHGPKTWVGGRR